MVNQFPTIAENLEVNAKAPRLPPVYPATFGNSAGFS